MLKKNNSNNFPNKLIQKTKRLANNINKNKIKIKYVLITVVIVALVMIAINQIALQVKIKLIRIIIKQKNGKKI